MGAGSDNERQTFEAEVAATEKWFKVSAHWLVTARASYHVPNADNGTLSPCPVAIAAPLEPTIRSHKTSLHRRRCRL